MDYEKAYKETLERAKKLKSGFEGYNANVAIIEKIFPELRESEDERIRKWIANYIHKGAFSEAEHPMALKAVEWLEKHKEQKPIFEVFGFKVGDAVRLKDGDGRKHIIKSFKEVKGIHAPNYYHVEFEDNSAIGGIYPSEEYPNGYYTQMEKFEKEHKSAEWSEEDEKMLKLLCRIVHSQRVTKVITLKEESELGEWMDKWLNHNPQPRWKPSDEQMDWLESAVRLSVNKPHIHGIIISLYEQLKRL